ncbi:beta-eliminating lyase-related protein [Agromyces endophyticus]
MADSGVTAPAGIPSSAWRLRSDVWEYLGHLVRQSLAGRARSADGVGGIDGTAGIDDIDDEIDVVAEFARLLPVLESLEAYWAIPGVEAVETLRGLIERGELAAAASHLDDIAPRSGFPRPAGEEPDPASAESVAAQHVFQALVVGNDGDAAETAMRASLRSQRRPSDRFAYELVVVSTVEDAMAAVLVNPEIQACVIRPGFGWTTGRPLSRDLRRFIGGRLGTERASGPIDRITMLAEQLSALRPELDLYLVAGVAIERLAHALTSRFRRIFRAQDAMELHLSLLAGVAERYEAPFFNALQEYSRRPTGAFHALPISRGASVLDSRWIGDLADFYGMNLFLAETSATSGGLDSLLDPSGSLRQAQTAAARAFGARKTVFVTNGTSTANKIVHQSIVKPGDVVLVDRNCHKSHHYALMLAGARVAYLDAYPLDEYSFYGAVPLETIKSTLLAYRRAGRLDEVKMIALTNCTFDGIVYDPQRVMEECLAIKPDLVFLWDEAWFAFAAFHPVYRRRTAMAAARELGRELADPAHRRAYESQQRELAAAPDADAAALERRLVADPARARLRVYATQSTHKTLTALRQGSMIHIHDEDFTASNAEDFHEAYMTHTSTSPNYQILASLDVGRRQVELEGYALVQRQADLAVHIGHAVARHPLLRKHFRILSTLDLVPPRFRETDRPMPLRDGLADLAEAWKRDEFVVDPSRLTLHIGLTGIDGDTFKHEHLMDRYGIQVNKTSRNTVLLMTNIGTSRSAVAYLVEVLVKIATELEHESRAPRGADRDPGRSTRPERRARIAVTPPLPDFSRFAARFRADGDLPDGDLRTAYFMSYSDDACEYLSAAEVRRRLAEGGEAISAGFVTPYPPGFPVLVPGQVITEQTLAFMEALDTREIHGFDRRLGYRVLVEPAATARIEGES